MRTREDLSEEVVHLRDDNREAYIKLNAEREKVKTLTAELGWWRTTFGPKTLNTL